MPHSLTRFLNLNERPPHPNLQDHLNAIQKVSTIATLRGENFQNIIDSVADMSNVMASAADCGRRISRILLRPHLSPLRGHRVLRKPQEIRYTRLRQVRLHWT